MAGRRLVMILVAVGAAIAGCGVTVTGGVSEPGGVGPGGPNGNGGVVGPPVVVEPQPDPGGGGGGQPGDPGRPSIEEPVPGQRNAMAVSVWRIEPAIEGRHVRVLLSWWSGPPPCSVLDSVVVERDGATIMMTPFEGSDPAAGDLAACPAIAMYRGTIVDLGELEPGGWTLAVPGGLAPVQITIE